MASWAQNNTPGSTALPEATPTPRISVVSYGGPGLTGSNAATPTPESKNLLTLNEYVNQVKMTGPSYLQGIANWKSNTLNRYLLAKHWNANVYLNPVGSGNYNDYDYNYIYQDGLNTNPGSYQYFKEDLTEQIGYNGNIVLSNNWDFGLYTSFQDNFHEYNTWPMYSYPNGTNIYNNTSDTFYLTLDVPLWQNFFGRSIHAQDQRDYLSNDSAAASDEFQIQSALYSAKLAYFNLALIRTELVHAREALQKYQELLDWAEARNSPQDVVQAQTALESEQLSIESLEDTERSYRDNFNLLRGVQGSHVEQDLMSLEDLNAVVNEPWDPKDPDRQDLKAARLQLESAKNNLIVSEEGTKLDLELAASVNGNLLLNDNGYPAPPPLTYPNLQNYSVGFTLNVPFDIFTPRWDASYKQTKISVEQGEVNLRETENGDSQQWEDMTIRYNKAAYRIATATSLVNHSKIKRDQGVLLFKKGRIDMFETLNFVGAYYSSIVTLQTWLDQKLALLAQADWYRAQPGLWNTNASDVRQ
jgi:outer membrane protein TolC